jgi:hypothetical protein
VKESIDIEDLLIWTYRDMVADKVAAARAHGRPMLGTSWAAVDRAVTLGAVVRAAPVELLPGDCDDAALVHAAVLALDDAFFAPAGDGAEASVMDRAMAAEVGGEILRQPGDRATLVMPDGSETAMRSITVSVYLVLHARAATRPDSYADVVRRRGRPRADGEIAPGLTFEDVMYARAVYAVWHAALGILSADLTDRLARWRPEAPKVDAEPWLRRTGRLLEAVGANNSSPVKSLVQR